MYKKKNKKGRGRIVMGIRKEPMEKGRRIETDREGISDGKSAVGEIEDNRSICEKRGTRVDTR